MSTIRITQPSVEPITLAEAKLWLKEDYSENDALISALIKSARMLGETITRRSFIESEFELAVDGFTSSIKLSYPKILSIVSVQYVDGAGVTQTIAPSDYFLDAHSEPSWLVPGAGLSWPETQSGAINTVKVRYRAGYGATAASVPENVKTWMLLHIGHNYRNREAAVFGAVNELPFVRGLLDSEICYDII